MATSVFTITFSCPISHIHHTQTYVCEIWYPIFQEKGLRSKLEPECEETARDWRKLHNYMPDDLYCLSDTLRINGSNNEMGKACGMQGNETNVYIVQKRELTGMTSI